MKILILEGDIYNAINGFRKDLFFELEKKHDVYLAGSLAYDRQKNEGLLHNKNIFLLGRLQTSFIGSFIYFIRISFVLIKINPDICLSFNVRPNFFLGLFSLFKKIKTLATITGSGFIFESKGYKVRIFQIIYRFLLSRFNMVFLQNSSDLNQMLANGFRFKSSKVIPGSGVDVERFKPSKINFSELGQAKFIFISRLIREKGFYEYIEAAKNIKKSITGVEFFVLGSFYKSGIKNSEINKQTIDKFQDQGIIKYLGHQQNVISYIEDADCIVLPSYREGMSNSLMESASLAKPIITTNVPGCKELVDDGITGFLCQVKTSEDLEQKMRLFINLTKEKRIEMGNSGREKMIKSFDRQGVIAEYLKFISSLK
jgi:glycosyltransferase involved in cell wall biosynthesis